MPAARRRAKVAARGWHARCSEIAEVQQMKDLVLIGVTAAFFALSWVYARSLDRL